jgi:hypothetical protein
MDRPTLRRGLAFALLPLVLGAGCGSVAVAKNCTVRGVVKTVDARTGVPCSVRFAGDSEADPSVRIVSGQAFEHSFPVLAPAGRFEQRLVAACEGYQDQPYGPITFTLGRLTCGDVDVGAIVMKRDALGDRP